MAFRFFISCLLVILAVGCCGKRPLLKSTTQSDSTSTERVISYRDTVYVSDSASVSTSFNCDSLINELLKADKKPFKMQSKNARLTITATPSGQLRIKSECDPLEIEARIRQELLKEFKSSYKSERIEVPVQFIPDWVKFLAYLGGIFLLLVVGYIILKIK
jgi:hypothetical protein